MELPEEDKNEEDRVEDRVGKLLLAMPGREMWGATGRRRLQGGHCQ